VTLATLLTPTTPLSLLLTSSGSLLSTAALPGTQPDLSPLLAVLTGMYEAYSPLDCRTVSINCANLTVMVTFMNSKYILATVMTEDACEGAVRKRMEGLGRVLEESLARVDSGV
jgi:hypothetical protein